VSDPLLAVRGVTSFYGAVMALKGVDLEVHEGEIVTLIGANGAGKSTLMMTIFGKPRARDGRIVFAGRDITDLPTHEIARLRIAQAPEGRRIFPRMTVLENLQMGAVVNPDADIAADLARVYALFPRLAERRDQRGGTLSGGEQQMLAIARALMGRPRLLLLDEPSLGLAPRIVDVVFDALAAIRERGLAVLLVEQRAQRTVALADRSYVLANGELRLTLGPDDADDTDRLVAAYLA
jgi:branched-chain amino acid transport system ATP-binding protein